MISLCKEEILRQCSFSCRQLKFLWHTYNVQIVCPVWDQKNPSWQRNLAVAERELISVYFYSNLHIIAPPPQNFIFNSVTILKRPFSLSGLQRF